MTDPTSLPNFPPPPGEHPLRGRVLDVLQDLGIAPNIDEDGDVAFSIDDQRMFVRCQDSEPAVMRVFGQWQIGDLVPEDRLVRLERCNDFTLQLNLVKAGIANDNLVVSAEHIITAGADLPVLLQVSVNLILQCVQLWHGSFAPQEGEDTDG